jgi:heme-degrading monooxygenase HmoA
MHNRICGVVQNRFHAGYESQANTGEVEMFARKVAARLKPNSLSEFARLMECEILPWLRKQEGFLDLITLAVPDRTEVATISFWDHKRNAQAYNSSGYPEVLKILGKLLDGTPYVKTFGVVGSTFQRITPEHELETGTLVQESGSVQLGCR